MVRAQPLTPEEAATLAGALADATPAERRESVALMRSIGAEFAGLATVAEPHLRPALHAVVTSIAATIVVIEALDAGGAR